MGRLVRLTALLALTLLPAAGPAWAEPTKGGVIDVATDDVETPESIVETVEAVMKFVPKERIVLTTNCGMAPMRREIAEAKLMALGAGAALAREKLG